MPTLRGSSKKFRIKWPKWFRILSCFVLFSFITNVVAVDIVHAGVFDAPQVVMLPPGSMVSASPVFSLPALKAIAVDPKDPFKIDFIVDNADQVAGEANSEQIEILTKYFLSFLALPEEDLWVNLSPYEQDRIITSDLEKTNAGRDMLAEDYVLKQLAASLTHPDHEPGRTFWARLFRRAKEEYGSQNIPINTFAKVWVVPDRNIVYEKQGSAYITQSRLKVLLDQDYLGVEKNRLKHNVHGVSNLKTNDLYAQVARELIIPELEREVNHGKNFAPLRQMYNALILAIWFKKRLKHSLINQVYANTKKTAGIDLKETQVKEKIYAQYLQAVKKGAYNLIRDDYDATLQENVPRKYFSGGFSFAMTSQEIGFRPLSSLPGGIWGVFNQIGKNLSQYRVNLIPKGVSKKALLVALGLVASGAAFGQDQRAPQGGYSDVQLGQVMSTVVQAQIKQIKALVSIDDVKALNGKTNALTGKPYQVDIQNLGTHSTAQGSVFTWREQAYVVAFHEKYKSSVPGIQLTPTGNISSATIQVINQLTAPRPEPVVAIASAPAGEQRIEHQRGVSRVMQPLNKALVGKITVDEKQLAQNLDAQARKLAQNIPLPTLNVATPSALAAAPALRASAPLAVAVVPAVAASQTARLVTQTALPRVSEGVMPVVLKTAGTKASAVTPVKAAVSPLPVMGDFKSSWTGQVRGWQGKSFYQAGEVLFNVEDINNATAIARASNELLVLNESLESRKRAGTPYEILTALKNVMAKKQELIGLKAQQDAGIVRAARSLKVVDPRVVTNGMTIAKDQSLFTFAYTDVWHINADVPFGTDIAGVYTINGKKIETIVAMNIGQDAARTKLRLGIDFVMSGLTQGKFEMMITPSTSAVNRAVEEPVAHIANGLGNVSRKEIVTMVSPEAGPIEYLRSVGSWVKAGESVARIKNNMYQEQAKALEDQIRAVESVITRSLPDAQGNVYMTQEKVEPLRLELARLQADLNAVRIKQDRLSIKATVSGYVAQVMKMYSGSVGIGETVLSIDTGLATIEGVTVSSTIPIKSGDRVQVQGSDGKLNWGAVVYVDQTPQDKSRSIEGVQRLTVRVWAPSLYPGNSVKVFVPTPDALSKRKLTAIPLPATSKTTALKSGAFADRLNASNAYNGNSMVPAVFIATQASDPVVNVRIPAMFPQGQTPTITLAEVLKTVLSRAEVTGAKDIEVQIQKVMEGMTPDQLNAQFGLYKDGQGNWRVGGGINGSLNDISFNLSRGSALGLPGAIANMVAISIVDVLRHARHLFDDADKSERQLILELAKIKTEMALNDFGSFVLGQSKQVTDVYIDLGVTQMRMAQVEDLIKGLGEARQVVERRVKERLSTTAAVEAIAQKIKAAEVEYKQLKAVEEQKRISLNSVLGHNSSLVADLPFLAQYDPLSSEQVAELKQRMMDKNPRLLNARKAQETVQNALAQENLNSEMKINIASTFISGDNGKPSTYTGFFPSWTTSGTNNVLTFTVPLLNKKQDGKDAIVKLRLQQAKLYGEALQEHLLKDFQQAVAQFNDAIDQSKNVQRAIDELVRVSNLKANGPEFYSNEADQQEIDKLNAKMLQLRADTLMAQAKLHELAALATGQTLVKPAKAAVKTQTQLRMPVEHPGLQKVAYRETVQPALTGVDAVLVSEARTQSIAYTTSPRTVPGVVRTEGADVTSDWLRAEGARNLGGPLAVAAEALVTQNNPIILRDTLNTMMKEFQNDKTFEETVRQVLLKTPFPEVRETLLRMVLKRKDIIFFVDIINKADITGNKELARMAAAFLGDLIIQDPESINVLNTKPSMSGVMITSQVIEEVLAGVIADQPISLQSSEVLRSDLWSPDQLVSLHRKITRTGKYNLLLISIKDEIMRRIAKSLLADHFNKGPFNTIAGSIITPDGDVFDKVRYEWLLRTNAEALQKSLHWKKLIAPELLKLAQQGADDLLAESLRNVTSGVSPLFGAIVADAHNEDPRSYFDTYGDEEQLAIIDDTTNISLLSRWLGTKTKFKGKILDKLAQTPRGSLLILDAYAGSSDDDLLGLIESRKLSNTYRELAQKIEDPVLNVSARAAFQKMYERSGDAQALNARLWTFLPFELATAKDPRGDRYVRAQADLFAVHEAVKAMEEKYELKWSFKGGYPRKGLAVTMLLERVRGLLMQSNDPTDMSSAIEALSIDVRGKEQQVVLEDLIWFRNKFAANIQDADQHLPWFPYLYFGGAAILGGIGGIALLGQLRLKWKRRKMSLEDLISLYRKEYAGKARSNIVNQANTVELPVLRSSLPPDIKKPFETWLTSLEALQDDKNLPDASRLQDILNGILNNARAIIGKLPFTPGSIIRPDPESPTKEKYMHQEHMETWQVFLHMVDVSLYLLKQNEQRLEKASALKPLEHQWLLLQVQMLTMSVQYAKRFLGIIDRRGNIDKTMGYKFPDHGDPLSFVEQWKIYPFFRFILNHRKHIFGAKEDILRDIPELLKEGNQILPGLYLDPETMLRQSKEGLTTVIANAETMQSPNVWITGYWGKIRRFGSRAFPAYALVSIVGFSVLSGFGVAGLTASPLSAAFGLALTLSIVWWSHEKIASLQWADTQELIMAKFRQIWPETAGGIPDEQAITSQIKKLSQQEAAQALDRELNGVSPGINRIVIIVQKEDDRDAVQQQANLLKGKLIRHQGDVEVNVEHFNAQGNGGIYLEALQRFGLGGRGKSLFILHDQYATQQQLEWAILTGYRVASKSNGEDQTENHIIVQSKNEFYGPVGTLSWKGLTLLTSRRPGKELSKLGNVITDVARNGDPRVVRLYEQTAIDEIEADNQATEEDGGSGRYTVLVNRFDVANTSVEQYHAFNGIVVLGKDSVELMKKVALGLTHNPDVNGVPIHFVRDLVIPLTLAGIENGIGQTARKRFLEKRILASDVKTISQDKRKAVYGGIHTLVTNAFNEVTGGYLSEARKSFIQAFVPYRDVLVINNGNGITATQVPAVSQAMTAPLAPGGLDLTATKENIDFKNDGAQARAGFTPDIGAMTPLGSFQGFEFKIIAIRPILNPSDLFVDVSLPGAPHFSQLRSWGKT